MRHILSAVLLVMSLAVPGSAATSSLPASFGSNSSGVVSGTSTIGGVTGTITSYSGGTWTMTVHGVTFATGTYNCGGGGCTYMGAVVGSTKTFNFTTTKTGSTSTATGFSTHGAWVSTVAGWANSHLSGSAVGKTVSDAARIEGDSASGGHGDGDGHGGGGGHSK